MVICATEDNETQRGRGSVEGTAILKWDGGEDLTRMVEMRAQTMETSGEELFRQSSEALERGYLVLSGRKGPGPCNGLRLRQEGEVRTES